MHEISLMYSILTIVKGSAKENQMTRISKIKLVVGTGLFIMPDSLLFAFHQLKDELFDRDAVLELEERAGRDFYIDFIEGE